MMAMPPANRVYVGHENVRYFVDLIFVVASQPRKPRKLDPSKISSYTVVCYSRY